MTRTYYPDGYAETETMYDSGLRNGVEITYLDSTGVMKTSGRYLNNFLTGEYITYYPNGMRYVVVNYDKGLPVGKKVTYSKYAGIQQEENYYNGKLDGWLKEYFENGKLKKEEMYKNGILETRKEYNLAGDLISTFGYK
jgi:antitoxin component YwqK of YwqJK toxin-antitoxin module